MTSTAHSIVTGRVAALGSRPVAEVAERILPRLAAGLTPSAAAVEACN